ncbi:hypothetical protein D3C86_2120120 [compost metagenome]
MSKSESENKNAISVPIRMLKQKPVSTFPKVSKKAVLKSSACRRRFSRTMDGGGKRLGLMISF